MIDVEFTRLEEPLFGRLPDYLPSIKAKDLIFSTCTKKHAVLLTRAWHSRLPKTQNGPWQYAFKGASYLGITYVVALWNNPSARTLPNNWLELRRLACSEDSPKNTCSRFISYMVKFFKKERPDISKLISYQDTSCHLGTIYKASNWKVDHVSKFRIRDRSKPRVGTNRMYRKNINGILTDASEKIRWAYNLKR